MKNIFKIEKCVLIILLVMGYLMSNGQMRTDLTSYQPTEIPAGATFEWRIGATSASSLVSTPASMPPGLYYGYYNFGGGCFSEGTPFRIITNNCPASTADLTTAVTTPPAGSTISYHSGLPISDANEITGTAITEAALGNVYYVAYRTAGAGSDCYSEARSIAVVETTCSPNVCDAVVQTTDEGASIGGSGFSGVCLGCSISDENNLIDTDTTNYASIRMSIGVFASGYIDVDLDQVFPSGTRAGFIANVNGSLAGLFNSATLTTYLGNSAQETISGGSLFNILGIGNAQNIAGTFCQPFDRIRITAGSLAGVIANYRIYNAFVVEGCNYPVACGETPGTEICGDGIDNDGDFLVDEEDDCTPPAEICDNGIDDDGDGDVDCMDSDCTAFVGCIDSDLDGVPDVIDLDDDNDGIKDVVELLTAGNGGDTDGDGIPDNLDLDSDNDGISDVIEAGGIDDNSDGMADGVVGMTTPTYGIPVSAGTGLIPVNTDGSGSPDFQDLDSDNDGINDVIEAGGDDANGDGIADGTVGTTPTTNGIPASAGTGLTPPNTDGTGAPDFQDLDSDDDGISDLVESGDPNATDVDDNGVVDGPDTDGDGIQDPTDGSPTFGDSGNPTPIDEDNDSIPNYTDLDSDDPTNTIGNGDDDIDVSGNGPLDSDDDGQVDPTADVDNDGIDDSIDGDVPVFGGLGVPDADGDGIPNDEDLDDDNDGITDVVELLTASNNGDTDGDGVPDNLDLDSDNDGINDVIEAGGDDANGDGIADGTVGTTPTTNGIPASAGTGLTPPNTDGTGAPDFQDLDSDDDGISDLVESGDPNATDVDDNGVVDGPDTDGDGIQDPTDGSPTFGDSGNPTPIDEDNDGVPNYTDLDSDDPTNTIGNGDDDVDESGNGPLDSDDDGQVDPTADVDNDGIDDSIDGDVPVFGGLGVPDADGDGIPNDEDLDDDNDGITDVVELLTASNNGDTDGDGVPDNLDLDSDNDGINDVIEAGGDDANGDGIADGTVGTTPTTNGIPASAGTGLTPPNTDGTGAPDFQDLDSDDDGISDLVESGDPNATDLDDNGVVDGPDTDGDGIQDPTDGSPTFGDSGNPTPIDEDNDSIPNYTDLDSDDPTNTIGNGDDDVDESGNGPLDGDDDGQVDPTADVDNDGIDDSIDGDVPVFGGLGVPDTDGDGIPNDEDLDDDNDGITDVVELLTASNNGDTDGDGIPDHLDLDADNDGINDVIEAGGDDANGDGIADGIVGTTPTTNGIPNSAGTGLVPPNTDGIGAPDFQDLDSDDDGISDLVESGDPNATDLDDNGVVDGPDTDGDGIQDPTDGSPTFGDSGSPTPIDRDGDGAPDYTDLDSDDPTNTIGNGDDDVDESGNGPLDVDDDGQVDPTADVDNDGIDDSIDGDVPVFGGLGVPDTDGDGIPNDEDLDDDNDGITDVVELLTASNNGDTDGDGIPDHLDLDADNDGINDVIEAGGDDANGDGIADGTVGTTPTTNGIPNSAGTGLVPPNTDGIGAPDFQDLDSDDDGISDLVESGDPNATDLDDNGVVDGPDTDGDGIQDPTDGSPTFGDSGNPTPIDEDNDSIPNYTDLDSDDPTNTIGNGDDDIDYSRNGPLDGNDNGQVDPTADMDNDGIDDSIDGDVPVYGGLNAPDTDGDGIPDHLDFDDDNDGITDVLENLVAAGNGGDTDGDGIPDRLDLDSDNDGIYDALEAGHRQSHLQGRLIGVTGANGLVDEVEVPSMNGMINYNLADSEASPDGFYDYTELDSDGDGCNDTNEASVNDQDANGIASFNPITVTVDGLVSGIVYATSPNYNWQNSAVNGCIENCTNGIDDDGDGLIDCADDDCGFAVSINIDNSITCNGATNGSITTVVGGGVGPYTYAWEGLETTSGLNNIGAGIYNVSVTDSNGCRGSQSITIDEPDALDILEDHLPVTCFGGSDGEIDITVTGGTGGYTFLWSNSVTTEDIENLSAGFYTVTATDASGCIDMMSIEITSPAALDITSTQVNVDCNNSLGSIDVTVTGGASPYVYLWDDASASNTEDLSGLSAGEYHLTVTDNTACSNTYSVIITETASGLDGNISTDQDICIGDTATITVVGQGGTGPYTYQWDNALGTAASYDVTPNTTTIYTVTITDASGCDMTRSVTITVIPCIEDCTNGIDDDGDGLIDCADDDCGFAVSINIDNSITCNGATNGSITTVVGGGVGPYTYAWEGLETTSGLNNIGAGIYNVSVTDSNGCRGSQSITIDEPDALDILEDHLPVTCFGGSDGEIDITVTGGKEGYTFLWSNSATTEDIENLSAGFYTVTATDASGCIDMMSIEITSPAALDITSTQVNVDCNNSLGSIDVTVTGGASPYVYLWNDASASNTEDLSGLSAGEYHLTVTDNTACSNTYSVTITETASGLDGNISTDQDICIGDTATITVVGQGGTGPYTYQWDNALGTAASYDVTPNTTTTYTVTITDASGCDMTRSVTITVIPCIEDCTNGIDDDGDGLIDCADDDCGFAVSINIDNSITCNGATNGSITTVVGGGVGPYTYAWEGLETTSGLNNIGAGIYNVTVTDSNGCRGSQSITIDEPDALDILEDHLPVTCFGGSDGEIDITVTGGTGGYTFLWSNSATTEDIENLSAGFYTVTATDASGCIDMMSIEITSPAALDITSTQVNVDCNNSLGSIDVMVTGGASPYVYLWDDASASNTEDLSGLSAGEYHLTVTDNTACSNTYSVTITETASGLDGNISTDQDICIGDTATITVIGQGGTGPYTYQWDNALGTAASYDVTPNTTTTYTVIITDASGCDVTRSVTITVIPCVNDCPSPMINITNAISCQGATDGSITAAIVGGVEPYTYLWNTGQNTSAITGISAGVYKITVTDANGCVGVDSLVLSEPSVLDINDSTIPTSCFGVADGEITLTVSGGASPYVFDWDNDGLGDQDDTQNLNKLLVGFYLVQVRDANGCMQMHQVEITEPAEINVSFDLTPPTCTDGSNGSIDATITNGMTPYVYQWDNDGTLDNDDTQDLSGLTAGTYNFTVTDNTGCSTAHTVSIVDSSTLESNKSPDPMICASEAVTIGVNPTGGNQPYSYQWSNGVSTEKNITVAPAAPSYYAFTVTDAVGCQVVDSIFVQTTSCGTPKSISIVGANTICAGDTSYLWFTIVDEDNGNSYDITYSDGITQFVVSDYVRGDSVIVEPLVETTYTIITASDQNGDVLGIGMESALIQLLEDTDGDGICDRDDICDQGDDNIDTDTNGIPDACESCAGSEPDAPIALQGAITSCEGDLTPPLVVTVPESVQVDWYDAPVGGVLISSNRTLYIPPSGSAVVYAEARHRDSGCVSTTRTRLEHQVVTRPSIDSLEVYCSADLSYHIVKFRSDESNLITNYGAIISLGDNRYMIDSIFTSEDVTIIASNTMGCDARLDVPEPPCGPPCIREVTDTITVLVDIADPTVDVCLPNDYNDIEALSMSINGEPFTEFTSCIPEIGKGATGLQITRSTGNYGIAIRDGNTACADSIILIVNSVFRDTIRIQVYEGDVGSECIPGVTFLATDIEVLDCEEENDKSVTYSWDDLLGCLSYNAIDTGIDTLCATGNLVAGGLINTTIIIESNELTNDLVTVDLEVDPSGETMSTVCLDTTELVGVVQLIEVGCESDNPSLTYTIIDSTTCIELSTTDEVTDTICVVICDDLGGCDTTFVAIETVKPVSSLLPIAVDDSLKTSMYTQVDIAVLGNDELRGDLEDVEIMSTPKHGEVSLNADMSVTYIATDGVCGTMDSFMYSLRTEHGEDQAMVYVNINCDSLMIYNGFSPNGDGVNDLFVIEGIEAYENNSVSIFNRWGLEVFSVEGYSNDNAWDGRSLQSDDLPDGTYFYLVDKGDGSKPTSGYVQIWR